MYEGEEGVRMTQEKQRAEGLGRRDRSKQKLAAWRRIFRMESESCKGSGTQRGFLRSQLGVCRGRSRALLEFHRVQSLCHCS